MFAPMSYLCAQAPTTAPASAAAPLPPDTVVLQVGDEKMTVAGYNDFVSALPEQLQEPAKGEAKRMLADQLVTLKLLAQEAQRRKLADDPKVKIALDMAREQALAQAMAESVATQADEAALKAEYEKNKDSFEQVHARHILIRTDDSPSPAPEGKKALTDEQAKQKAQEIRARLVDKKENFADVAKAESDDTGSAARGGDLGFFTRGRMVASFEEAAMKLKPGEISQPVKSAFGYHIIEVLERKSPTFEEVKPQLAAKGGGERVNELLKKLRDTQKVVVNEKFFGPAAPAMPGMPMP